MFQSYYFHSLASSMFFLHKNQFMNQQIKLHSPLCTTFMNREESSLNTLTSTASHCNFVITCGKFMELSVTSTVDYFISGIFSLYAKTINHVTEHFGRTNNHLSLCLCFYLFFLFSLTDTSPLCIRWSVERPGAKYELYWR